MGPLPNPKARDPAQDPIKVHMGGSVPIGVQVWVGSSSNVAASGPASHYV